MIYVVSLRVAITSYLSRRSLIISFFFNDTATTEIYTLSLHDALPICRRAAGRAWRERFRPPALRAVHPGSNAPRSEEHTSELQSLTNLVCRLLLEKKKKNKDNKTRQNTNNEQKNRKDKLHSSTIIPNL